MTTDEALIEQIAQALFEDSYPTRLDGWPGVHGRFRAKWIEKAAAVLPTIRKAERDAAREALDGLLDTWGISQTLDSDYEKGYSSGQRDGFGRIITYRNTHHPEEETP